MEISTQVRDLVCAAGMLLESLHEGHGFSDEEYEVISAVSRKIEMEVFLYRLEHYKPSSETVP
jgi:hypothetical protein